MSMPPHTPTWANQASFSGSLYLLDGGAKVPITHFLNRYGPSLSGGFERSAGDTGWLRASGTSTAMTLHFQYQGYTAGRLQFMLALDSDRERKLGISRNGYLGLYKHAEVSDFWKLEPLNWRGDELRCRLRDHQGHQVKASPDSPFYLLVGEGNTHDFLIVRQP